MHRRSDQLAVGAVVIVALTWLAVYWYLYGRSGGRLIEIDRAEALESTFQIDINTADWIEFAQLPRIGETMARRIIESRAQDGPFKKHEDLCRVRGIGPKTLEQIEGHLLPLDGE